MALSTRLQEKTSAIVQRWLADALAAYPAETVSAFQRQKDPFANPVGHALRVGMRAAVEALLERREPAEICSCLDDIIKIRAVQELKPSEAIRFVFSLKGGLRAELGSQDPDGAFSSELAEFDQLIDLVALGIFDIYMRYRGQICELRINEVKRSVAGLVEQMGSWPLRSNGKHSQLGPLEFDQSQRGDDP